MTEDEKHERSERAIEVCRRLDKLYGSVECFLDHENPFRLTISVLLSAQTTDAQVNTVTPELFERWPTAEALAAADVAEVEEVIRPVGFYRTKAAHAVAAAQMIVSDFDGEVPHTMEELCRLPGVGRKTANIVLNVGFGIVEGIAVDTHVMRIAHRLGLSDPEHEGDPKGTEQDLLAILPQELWGPVNHQWILHGRQTCTARNPACSACILADLCPSKLPATGDTTGSDAPATTLKKAP